MAWTMEHQMTHSTIQAYATSDLRLAKLTTWAPNPSESGPWSQEQPHPAGPLLASGALQHTEPMVRGPVVCLAQLCSKGDPAWLQVPQAGSALERLGQEPQV